ncbi:MAG: hypothetical protein DRO98_02960 [Archaeoglobales archaeon]|nr:MAG: hypothetical protein DRO98_02960 [Archaeoglobales archaeon]HDN73408.1 hypothetical protein [Archaeoglobus sp.]
MRYKIVKIEMKDENTVTVYMRREGREVITAPDIDEAMKDPFKLMELSRQMGMAYMRAIERSISEDAMITMKYEEYCELELKVGDVVEVSVKHV